MLLHSELRPLSFRTSRFLFGLIQSGEIRFAGNSKLRIYGLLNCRSGRRMKQQNRIFFSSEAEARENGYRPCAHCMRQAYLQWKRV
ncbi:Ada metal-binding domain-containing protein [Dyadobacter sp. Leaf189]|uniref:Ada metal-binding domain-containing protein n=1 Tax=Dyadobacter sp. Leaf189 TaxID=1736295 RepID=UPI0006F84E74|nr:Ada metal-binding domain-containing protein [Dyadobacter sp. Leaf189]KQS28225.1 metal-binding protein [Dyadobacter sp. Leaf189]